jgi:hypothetical protein
VSKSDDQSILAAIVRESFESKCTLELPRRQVRKVPEPGTETCLILFRGRPGVQETSVSGGVTAVRVVFPI